jgi:ribosomal protein S18 acetylase RimI-like enzyme
VNSILKLVTDELVLAEGAGDADDARLAIRTATVDDTREVMAVLAQSYRQFEPWLPWSAVAIHLAELFELRRSLRDAEFLVAVVDGRVEGVAMCVPMANKRARSRRWLRVRALGVTPRARRRGLARALLRECAVRGLAGGAGALCLHVAAFMRPARALVEALGFMRMREYDFPIGAAYGVDEPITMRAYVLPFE